MLLWCQRKFKWCNGTPLRVQVAAVRLALEGQVACAGSQEHEKIKEQPSRSRLIGVRTGFSIRSVCLG